MRVTARVQNAKGKHDAVVATNNEVRIISIPSKPTGFGSSVNGAELLFLALATCYCNDVYREAAQRNIDVVSVDVSVDGDFGAAGEPAGTVTYHAHVTAKATEHEIKELMVQTDKVAEIQNTLRMGTPVAFGRPEATSI